MVDQPNMMQQKIRWLPYYILLGELISVWDRVEMACAMLFGEIMGIKQQTIHAIFHSSRSIDLKFDMIRNSLETLDADEETSEQINKLIDRVEKLSRKRNGIIHAQWVLTHFKNEDPEDFAPPLRVTVKPSLKKTTELIQAAITRNPKYQKEFGKSIFTTDEIRETTANIETLNEDMWALFRILRSKRENVGEARPE